MKRIFITLLLILVSCLVLAKQLVRIDISQSTGRQSTIRGLSQSGFEVYHYNTMFAVASADDDISRKYHQSKLEIISQLPALQNIYLITKNPEALPEELGAYTDLGDQVLLISGLDDVELRGIISNPFVELELIPIKLAPETGISTLPRSETRSIEDLISYINPDSVMWFIQNLQDFQTRYALAPNRLQVANWIRDQFLRFGITNAQVDPFQWNGTTQYNVVATITGTDNPDQYVIVGGHHDSIVNNADPYVFAPGADDNATGTVAALEMARVMMQNNFQPKSSIRFVTFAAEEFGLWGAKDYAEYALQSDMNIILMINHDMIGHSQQSPDNWQVRLMPYDGSMQHTAHAASLTTHYTTLNPTYGSSNSGSSDSHPFWVRGFPVIYFFEQVFCPYYHSVNDITDYVNADYCAEVIRASASIAASYASMPGAPSNLTVQDGGNGSSLVLNWTNVNDPLVSSYHVYHNTTGTGFENPVVVTPSAGATTSFTIGSLTEGTTYYVAVCSVDINGNESYYMTSQGTPYSLPQTPVGFSDVPDLGEVTLSWQPNQEADIHFYELYRSDNASDDGILISSIYHSSYAVPYSYTDTDFSGNNQYYYYKLYAVDFGGSLSPVTSTIRSRPVTLNSGILVIDETLNGSGTTPFQPNDAQVDQFYTQILENAGYVNVPQLDLEAEPSFRVSDIGIYSSILWHGNDQADYDAMYNHRDEIARYIDLGGNLLFTSYLPTQAIALNNGYPATFNINAPINSVFGINGADYSNAARFKYAISALSSFPPLTVDPNKTTTAFNGHIFKVEALSPSANAQTVYYYGSDYENSSNQGVLNDLPVAIYIDHDPGKILTLSFPLYNMTESSASALIQHVFNFVFQEPTANDDPALPAIPEITIYPNNPNPFTASTRFRIDLKRVEPVSVSIYNLKGQLVKNLFDGKPISNKTSFVWDGKDSRNAQAANGIYFIKVEQNGRHQTRKLMKIK